MKNVIEKLSKVRMDFTMKVAAAKLLSTGSLKGFRLEADGRQVYIGEISYVGDLKDLQYVVGVLAHGSSSKMERFKAPIEVSGSGESKLTIRDIKFSYGSNLMELDSLEFTSLWEAGEFFMEFLGEGLEFIK